MGKPKRGTEIELKECRLLGCVAVWLLQEPYGDISQKTAFFIVTAVKI
jgi:hypothetical protein